MVNSTKQDKFLIRIKNFFLIVKVNVEKYSTPGGGLWCNPGQLG